MGRGLIILLIFSLAANVFLGGFVAGRFLGGPHPHPNAMAIPGEIGGRGAFRNLEALTEGERTAFRAVFREKRSALRASFHDILKLRAAFGEALAADPWDRARVETALFELKAAEGARESALAALVIDAFEGLPAEKRKALVEAAASHESHSRGRGRRHDRNEPHQEAPPPADDADAVPPPNE